MSISGLARLWAIIGGVLALYAIGIWIVLQGGKSFAELPGLEARSPVTSAYEAVLIVGVLLGILSIIGLLHLRKVVGPKATLLPVVAIDDTGPHVASSWSMRIYQGFFLAIFILLPSAALYQLNTVVLQRGILWHEGAPTQDAVVVKNVFALTHGTSSDDIKEHSAWRDRAPSEGFTWLANTRCDLVKWTRPEVGTSEAKPSNLLSGTDVCKGANDVSEICESSKRHCRGMQWLPELSPALLAGSTLFGLVSAAVLFIGLAYRKSLTIAAGWPARTQPNELDAGASPQAEATDRADSA